MIQRIQTIYLLLAGIFPAITFFIPWFGLANKSQADTHTLITTLSYDSTLAELAGRHPLMLIILVALSIILAFAAIFAYRNRKRQIQVVNGVITLNALTLIAATFTIWNLLQEMTDATFTLGVGLAFPLLSIVSALLARRAIKHDEALVRAADRIR